MIVNLVNSVRPQQWYKNLLLFVGLVFSQNLLNNTMWLTTLASFLIFCGISAGGYLINDVFDKEVDKKHPEKSRRPIAKGFIKPTQAIVIGLVVISLSLLGSCFVNIGFFLITLFYVVLMFLYTWKLKHIIILDIMVISVGFIIRAVAGCLAINVNISSWLIVCAFLLALFLALGKRRHELILLGDKNSRASVNGYSPQMLDQLIGISAGSLILSYLLYAVSSEDYYLLFTVPFAVYGLFRYLFLVHSNNIGGEPQMIFKDKPMVTTMGLWTVSFVVIIYRAYLGLK